MKLTKFLILTILLLFPFGQLTKIPLKIPDVSLYLQDLVICLLLFWWILNHIFKKKAFPKPPLTSPIIAFSIVALFSLLINFGHFVFPELLISSLYLLRWGAYAVIYFVIYEITKKGEREVKADLLKLLMLTGVTTAILGFLQYLLYPNLRNLYYLGWDPHHYRLFGTFFDPGFLGLVLVLTLILLLNLETFRKFSGIFFGALVYSALALTYSRSSYLALIVALVVLACVKKSLKFLLIPLFLLVFTILILPRPAGEGVKLERSSTVQARFENWRQTLKIIRDQPVFGVGFNCLRFVKKKYGFLDEDWLEIHSGAGADSSFLFVWATTGVLGLGAYLWVWWKIIQRTLGEIKNGRKQKLVGRLDSEIILSTTVALFVHSLFLNSLFYPWIMIWLWFLTGIIHGRVNESRGSCYCH